MSDNPMRRIYIEKVVLNIGTGSEGKPEHAKELLERITGRKAVITRTHKRTTFGMARNRPIGAKVTVRENAEELIRKLLKAVGNRIKASSFDREGNVAFGIEEYILIPGLNYNPDWGIIGMDVCIRLARPGFSIARKSPKRKVGKAHRITPEEAMAFMKGKFGVEIVG